MIELYIEGKKIDLNDDLKISMNYESIDPENLSNVKNSFSKSIKLPSTPNNDLVFGHIFRFDKVLSPSPENNALANYNPHYKTNFQIFKNGFLVEDGYCIMDKIDRQSSMQRTYNITLYGGLGNFFNSIKYKEDGTERTMEDMYWNWFCLPEKINEYRIYDRVQEDTMRLTEISPNFVANSLTKLDPNYHYNYHSRTDIDKDVVSVPCYTGLYENFDSKHMIVSTANNFYNSFPNYFQDNIIRSKLRTAFPSKVTDSEGFVYNTFDESMNPNNFGYGLAEFSRDIDPWEAGSIRVNEMPLAIRLSKVLSTISNPENNGGYNVEWDQDILDSYYWKYSWIMLDKIAEENKETIVGNLKLEHFNIEDNYVKNTLKYWFDNNESGGGDYAKGQMMHSIKSTSLFTSVQEAGDYNFNIKITPKIGFNMTATTWKNRFKKYGFSSVGQYVSPDGQQNIQMLNNYYTLPVILTKCQVNNVIENKYADVFFYTTGEVQFDNSYLDTIKSWIEQEFDLTLDNITIHTCGLSKSIGFNSGALWYEKICSEETINGVVNVQTNNSTINFKQEHLLLKLETHKKLGGVMELTPASISLFTDSNYKTYKVFAGNNYQNLYQVDRGTQPITANYSNYNGYTGDSTEMDYVYIKGLGGHCEFKFDFGYLNMTSSYVYKKNAGGYNNIQLTKKLLFNNAKKPIDYLLSFAKILNLKFTYDKIKKTINILPYYKYYKDITTQIDDIVDEGKSISINRNYSKYNWLGIDLGYNNSYPVILINRTLGSEKFNEKKFYTGINWSVENKNLFEKLGTNNILDWQQKSIFYNLEGIYPRPYCTPTISWTLFNIDSTEEDKLRTFTKITSGDISNSLKAGRNDIMPKLALFDDNLKYEPAESSFIFLNGYVRNYNYTVSAFIDDKEWLTVSPIVMLNADNIMENLFNNGSRCYLSNYNIAQNEGIFPSSNNYCYRSVSNNTAAPWYMPFFSRDLYNVKTKGGGAWTPYQPDETIDGYFFPDYGTLSTQIVKNGMTILRINLPEPLEAVDTNLIRISGMWQPEYIDPQKWIGNVVRYYNNNNGLNNELNVTSQEYSWTNYVLTVPASTNIIQINTCTKLLNTINIEMFVEGQGWVPLDYKVASWNINYQEVLDNLYSLENTDFVREIRHVKKYSEREELKLWRESNEYKFECFPQDAGPNTRIYNKYWSNYLNNIYFDNGMEVELWLDTSKWSDPNDLLRQFYIYKGQQWIITKVFDYNIDYKVSKNFTKVRMNKIYNKQLYLN